ncbi:MAG: aldolase/citrate lyase family protein [Planctomycetia bacterium]|jgi:4-hydroxy-2-oxoheptanedioate aldolase
MIRKSIIKQKLAAGENVLATKIGFNDANLVEMVSMMGFDAIWLCNEYRPINPTTLEDMVRAARTGGADSIVRIGRNCHDIVPLVLSMGANGIMVPRVQTAKQAKKVIDRIKFPPQGKRDFEHIGADADLGLMPSLDFLRESNDQSVVILQIEDKKGMKNLDEIAEVEGIDVLFFGPGDFSLDYGIPCQPKHSKVIKAIDRVVKACEENGLACATPAIDSEHGKFLLDRGVRMLADGSDWGLLVKGFRNIRETYRDIGFRFREEREI